MKHAILLFLFLIGTNIAAQNSDQWWSEAKSHAQKLAKLKSVRFEARQKIFDRIRLAVDRKVQIDPKINYDRLYDSLIAQAEPEFQAISQKFDPQIEDAQNQYLAFLQQIKPSQETVLEAKSKLHPTILYTERAKYTESARQNRIQGTVIVNAVFAADGQIKSMKVLRGLPFGMNDEALKAAKELVFLPANLDGTPVSVRMSVEYSFNLI